jgi:hypothetical protein
MVRLTVLRLMHRLMRTPKISPTFSINDPTLPRVQPASAIILAIFLA